MKNKSSNKELLKIFDRAIGTLNRFGQIQNNTISRAKSFEKKRKRKMKIIGGNLNYI